MIRNSKQTGDFERKMKYLRIVGSIILKLQSLNRRPEFLWAKKHGNNYRKGKVFDGSARTLIGCFTFFENYLVIVEIVLQVELIRVAEVAITVTSFC